MLHDYGLQPCFVPVVERLCVLVQILEARPALPHESTPLSHFNWQPPLCTYHLKAPFKSSPPSKVHSGAGAGGAGGAGAGAGAGAGDWCEW